MAAAEQPPVSSLELGTHRGAASRSIVPDAAHQTRPGARCWLGHEPHAGLQVVTWLLPGTPRRVRARGEHQHIRLFYSQLTEESQAFT